MTRRYLRLNSSAISTMLRRNNSISDALSIRGPGEVTSLRFSKAVETVTEPAEPPPFEFGSMFAPECVEGGGLQAKPGRVRLSGEYASADHQATAGQDVTPQVCEGAALADEVIHENVLASRADATRKRRLARQPCEAGGAGVPDDVGLHHRALDLAPELEGETLGQHQRDRVHTRRLQGVDGEEPRLGTPSHLPENCGKRWGRRVGHEPRRRRAATCLRLVVVRVTLHFPG